MAWSKSTRIKVMITIDTAFFLLELIAGFLAHSLALTADAFHMLNDVISLVIGLWAVSAAQKATTDEFTFGWVRAEILGAFFNAVFLIALCVSIILEALTRFVEPPEIDSPKLMLIVGSAGLFSNLVGFFVLGGHGHGGHSHGHDDDDHDHAHNHAHSHAHDEKGRAGIMADESDAVGDVPLEVVVCRATAAGQSSSDGSDTNRRIRFGDQHRSTDEPNTGVSWSSSHSRGRNRCRSSTSRHSRLASIDEMSIYPASFRQDIIAASMATSGESPSESDANSESPVVTEKGEADEESPLLKSAKGGNSGTLDGHKHPSHSHSIKRRTQRDSSVHNSVSNNQVT